MSCCANFLEINLKFFHGAQAMILHIFPCDTFSLNNFWIHIYCLLRKFVEAAWILLVYNIIVLLSGVKIPFLCLYGVDWSIKKKGESRSMYLSYFSFRKIPYDIRLDSILHVACFWHVASLVRLQYTFCFKLFNFFIPQSTEHWLFLQWAIKIMRKIIYNVYQL